MILEDLKAKKDFTETDRSIADYLLEKKADCVGKTTEQIARETYTSKAAIIRFCKKMGFESFRDFMRSFERETKELYRMSVLMDENSIDENSSVSSVLNVIPAIYDTAITSTRMCIDEAVVRRAAKKIVKAPFVEIYGLGVAYNLGNIFAFLLNSIGIRAGAFCGINDHAIESRRDEQDNVDIVLSMSGKNPYIIKTAKAMKDNGYYTFGIMGGADNEIKKYCHDWLRISHGKGDVTLSMTTGVNGATAMKYLLDVLFVTTMVMNYEKNRKNDDDAIKSIKLFYDYTKKE